MIRWFWILDHEIKGNITSFLKPNELDRVDLFRKKDQEQLSEIDKKLSIIVNILVIDAKKCKNINKLDLQDILLRFCLTGMCEFNKLNFRELEGGNHHSFLLLEVMSDLKCRLVNISDNLKV